ncbi:hypothetical protein GGTG_14208 [Gaeumannomyces tritici R3-111a-1]|uniref:Uncharacterized protein n=1 Tax=Gaeumannomyces tritici (strain R3-111a-1) TaxID=644352 RepID=J3PKY3_GAET3|nr:hypothetical protein GGTG_14208 [Gaeumannomyces tritici R3-111a-1]EJT68212.1 hypothetical protein GGTG_14208 [Gaeumannomyces tritici R3-111a-1]
MSLGGSCPASCQRPFFPFLPGGFARAFNASRFLPGGFARAFNILPFPDTAYSKPFVPRVRPLVFLRVSASGFSVLTGPLALPGDPECTLVLCTHAARCNSNAQSFCLSQQKHRK